VGITVFAAAGNGGQADKLMAPACVSGVVAVGNVYDAPLARLSWPTCVDQNIKADQVACSSNSSPALDLLAPGVSITSAKLGGGQTALSGTSMSTPHAAAVAALLLQADPSLTPAELEALLKTSGVPVTDQRNNQITPRIEALTAVTQLTGSEAITLSGTVLLEGRANHSGSQIFVSDGPCSTPLPANPTTTTQADGRFEIISFAEKPAQCLQARQVGYLVGQREAPAGNLGTITLPGGYVTGDGVIDIFDLAFMASRYGTKDAQADITANGLVDIFDLAIAAKNYEAQGPVSRWK
jgi:subtilisin family serine protease